MFDSPVEAVRCAIVIQQSMMGRNTSLPREQWILYRIGVHLGDVIVETSDVYGEGVNVAARLEGIATPGDLYISGGVYEQIKNKLVCAYQSLGDRQVKNVTDPVSVYRVLPDPAALNEARKKRWPVAMVAALIVCVIAILGGGYFLLLKKYVANQAPAPSETQQINDHQQRLPTRRPRYLLRRGCAREVPKESSSRTPAVTPIAPQLIPRKGVSPRGHIRHGE